MGRARARPGRDRQGEAGASKFRDAFPSDPRRHPATESWKKLGRSDEIPERVEVLTLKPKSAVFRLFGVGTGGSTVIAKRCSRGRGRVERMVYEHLLPHLPLRGLEYYGFFADEESGDDWLFLGDVGEGVFSFENAAHHQLAVEWIGTLHRLGRGVPGADRLPARGAHYYLSHLRIARRNIRENLENPALTAQDRVVLRSIAAQLDVVEDGWGSVERFCERFPRTVVHGDFCKKNIIVGVDGDRPAIFPVDWEMAGWGVPAIDLSAVDPDRYWGTVGESWPELTHRDIEDLARYGRLFRSIMGVSWGSVELTHEWVMETMYKMAVYDVRLGQFLAANGA